MSLEVQKEQIDKMKLELKPSRVYWLVDAGVSGEDFDRRKLRKILELRERGEVDELWVTYIDRIGRECRKSLLFFLQFTEDNGIIRTLKGSLLQDLADILIFTIESFGAEVENKRRAQRANDSKIKNFKSGKWNKPIPLGYTASNNWIAKMSARAYIGLSIMAINSPTSDKVQGILFIYGLSWWKTYITQDYRHIIISGLGFEQSPHKPLCF